MTRPWTSPAEITAALERLWDKGHLLVPPSSDPLFPLLLPLRGPTSHELSERFPEVQAWIASLRDGGTERRGFGYAIELKSVRHRTLGPNKVPSRVIIPTLDDALALLGRRADHERWQRSMDLTRQRCPELITWCHRFALRVLHGSDIWDKALAVVLWFRRNPLPGIYRRQIDLPGVDTKFIEQHASLITSLLDAVLPPEHIHAQHVGVDHFEDRYGLKTPPQLVQMRSLDPRFTFGGLRHVAASIDELRSWNPPPLTAVIITENMINGLILPDHSRTLALFGLGHSIGVVEQCSWLRRCPIHYWGDIDTHGFAMLSRLRGVFPQVTSMLMDEATLRAHTDQWGEEHAQLLAPLPNLTADELRLFDDLAGQRHGPHVRLEQERIAYGRITDYLREKLDQ